MLVGGTAELQVRDPCTLTRGWWFKTSDYAPPSVDEHNASTLSSNLACVVCIVCKF